MFMTPAGYNETSANTTTDGSDSDADPATGNAPLTNLVSGESDQTIDAGIYRPATIGDYVWRDTDGDGIQDPTESGINGITVVLKEVSGATVATTITTNNPTTGAAGYYQFSVDPGTYAVMVMVPTGNTVSPSDAVGSTDGNDSDINPTTGTSPNVTVTSGSTNQTIDAGLYQTASLGNYVWEDADKDGVQDATELGVNGVTVLLKNAAGSTLQTTTTTNNPTTGAAGYYQFSNLAPGDYIVMFMTPAGYNETSANTTTDGNDSDADPATGNAPLTNLVSGESDQTIDAGIYRPATIGDYVWRDTDGDGIQDPTESGINGITVVLKDASGATVATTTTTNNPTTGTAGYYQFSVDPGTYAVMVMVPSGNTVSPSDAIGSTDVNDSDINPTTGTSPNITVTSGSTNQTIDAGLYQTASLGNYVWEDADKDGVQDATELGVNGVTVLLKNAAGATLQSTTTTNNPTTGAAGYYQFSNLAPGDYIVMFMTPAGYNETSANTTTDGSDSDADPATGNAPLTNLVSGESDQTIDAGIYRPATIGDYVWRDTDGDGIQDPTESGINGITVVLKDASGATVATTTTTNNPTTGAAGYYQFSVDPGTYAVMLMVPTGNTVSPSDAVGSTDGNDSDINPTTGTSPSITVTSGSTNQTIDAGLYQTASLGNYVWEDADKDGVQDATELGVNGVTVLLKNAAGATLQSTTTTNNPTTGAAGYYQFSNLAPGDYIVMFMTPVGYNETSANTTTDGSDSDADPATGNAPLTNLVSGESDQTIDAGIYRPATIGDYVWRDTDGDGIQDPTESGINGITVVLKDASGATVATTTTTNNPTTGAAGYYQFSVDPGTYAVMVMVPAGSTVSPSDAVGSTDVNDSDINPTTGTSPNITVTSGSTNQTIDAGLYQTASLGNYVWEDADKDGVQDATELGVNGVTVLLKNAAGATLQSTTTTNNPTTGAAGYYQFSNLAPGDYIVMFMTPAGYNETSANTTTDGSDSDADPATGNAPLTNLVSGESDQTIDAGIYRPATIGDYVWRDTDGDGIQDPTESGINGITVVLKDASGATVATTTTTNNPTTGAAGYYQFSVDPGTYAVMVMVPSGSTVSPNDAVGSTDVNDSDINPTTGTSPNITVTSGSTNNTIDAGLYQAASLGNYVWFDEDHDGVQDVSELGINGFVVNLYNAAGTLLNTTTTTTNPNDGKAGYYQFSNLAPGSYFVQIVPTAGLGYISTIQNNQPLASEATDSDITGLHGANTTSDVTLVSGQNYPDLDAGYYLNNVIGNYVWNDVDRDGVQEAGEPGINGVVVTLYSSTGIIVEQMITTNSPTTGQAGWYQFDNLLPGNYYVQFSAPDGYFTTLPNTTGEGFDSDITGINGPGTTAVINVAANTINNDVDAGLYQAVRIGNFVWNDTGADNSGQTAQAFNGVQDSGELPQSGITVILRNLAGVEQQRTTTDARGEYYFYVVPNSGSYYIEFVAPSGFGFTQANVLANSVDALDSDVSKTFGEGTTSAFTVGTLDNLTIDAGIYLLVLPLEWISFEANCEAGNVSLEWTTANEKNISQFEIERRHESESSFTKVGSVIASNAKNHSYSYTDLSVKSVGTNYYRIRSKDLSGKTNVSKVEAMTCNSNTAIEANIYPNPFNEYLTFDITNVTGSITITIIDENGRAIASKEINATNKTAKEVIETQLLPSGIYVVKITNKNQVLYQKLIKN
ncbi:MAG: T9SS type A sorting domain-containing protein [Saprospiraceae bacterium]|nr:T9SS type A sorting domain-containing protein [Saprospiraceae bacterium]